MTSNEIKSLKFDDKIEYFRGILSDLDNRSETDILNVFRLVNTYNTFDEDFFAHKDSYIADISEFIDLKMALDDEIREFSTALVTWYLSILASCDIKADDDANSAVDMPMLVYGFLSSATIPVMSSLMNSIDMSSINMTKLYKVKGAFFLLSKLFQSHAFVAHYLEKM